MVPEGYLYLAVIFFCPGKTAAVGFWTSQRPGLGTGRKVSNNSDLIVSFDFIVSPPWLRKFERENRAGHFFHLGHKCCCRCTVAANPRCSSNFQKQVLRLGGRMSQIKSVAVAKTIILI